MTTATNSGNQGSNGFPNAPSDWSPADAGQAAVADGLQPNDGHWDAVRALQEYYARHTDGLDINVRELHDALDEKFHARGGMKFLYRLFPGGPIAQGCRIAGLVPPAGSKDTGFGSVQ